MSEMRKLIDIMESNQSFKKISYDEFETVASSSADYDETHINGYSVIVAYNGMKCIAVYYKTEKFASYNPNFAGGLERFTEDDPYYPFD